MKRFGVLSLVVVAMLAGCSKPKPVVVLDSWWDAGMAQKACVAAKEWVEANKGLVAQKGCDQVKGCTEATRRAEACASDATGGNHDFETKLAARFAADTACEGVQFEQITDPNAERKAAGSTSPHWQLMISFVPGAPAQLWELSGPASEYAKNTGTADDIPGKVCTIVTGQGGRTVY